MVAGLALGFVGPENFREEHEIDLPDSDPAREFEAIQAIPLALEEISPLVDFEVLLDDARFEGLFDFLTGCGGLLRLQNLFRDHLRYSLRYSSREGLLDGILVLAFSDFFGRLQAAVL